MVHRDLASRNLLLDDGFHVRISDFGFSRVKRECASRGYTRSDMGPIKWTSPEAMRKRCYSEASDAFSFGVVLYEMFARSPPWEGNENLDVAFRVCSGERMTVRKIERKDLSCICLSHDEWNVFLSKRRKRRMSSRGGCSQKLIDHSRDENSRMTLLCAAKKQVGRQAGAGFGSPSVARLW